MKKIVINGLFLTQQLSGVQRNAIELVKELDKIVGKDFCEIAVPVGTEVLLQLRNIRIVHCGRFKGRLWEQISFFLYIIKNHSIALNFCNTAPLCMPGITMICDVIFKHRDDFPQEAQKYRKYLSREIQTRFITAFSKKILTISNFSAMEIKKFYNVSDDKIVVIPCAWQHYQNIQSDDTILDRINLKSGEYYFAMSNIAKHKNFKWVLQVAKNNLNSKFVISGSYNKRHFDEDIDAKEGNNILYLGYVTDEEAKGLMANCKAFLSPTYYEGFGIPPMEALSIGRNIIISDIPVYREIYEDSAHYIRPDDYTIDLETLLFENVSEGKKIIDKYSWHKSAIKLNDELMEICRK